MLNIISLFAFFVKAEILFGFLLVSENRYQCTFWKNEDSIIQTFEKRGIPVYSYNEILYSKKDEQTVATQSNWVNLTKIVLNKRSQRQSIAMPP